MEKINKVKLHEEIILGMHQLYIDKNQDYGDSFEKVRAEYPYAIAIRLSDKLERVKTLLKQEAKVVDEKLDDTLTDLANYCILELIERRTDDMYLKSLLKSTISSSSPMDSSVTTGTSGSWQDNVACGIVPDLPNYWGGKTTATNLSSK